MHSLATCSFSSFSPYSFSTATFSWQPPHPVPRRLALGFVLVHAAAVVRRTCDPRTW